MNGCQGETTTGYPCRRLAKPGGRLCAQHEAYLRRNDPYADAKVALHAFARSRQASGDMWLTDVAPTEWFLAGFRAGRKGPRARP